MAKVELEEPFFRASWKPSVLLELEFAGEAVKFGNFLSPAQAAVEPVVSFFHVGSSRRAHITVLIAYLPLQPIPALYTLILVDPDAFARAGAGDNSISPVNHWIQQGLKPPSVDEDPDPSKGLAVEKTTDVLVPYIGPGPPPKTGYARSLRSKTLLISLAQGSSIHLPSLPRDEGDTSLR